MRTSSSEGLCSYPSRPLTCCNGMLHTAIPFARVPRVPAPFIITRRDLHRKVHWPGAEFGPALMLKRLRMSEFAPRLLPAARQFTARFGHNPLNAAFYAARPAYSGHAAFAIQGAGFPRSNSRCQRCRASAGRAAAGRYSAGSRPAGTR